MSEPTLTLMASGAYRLLDADSPPTFADLTPRWTAYCRWPLDPPVPVDAYGAAEEGQAYIEEIDVEAPDYASAWKVAEAALARDFEPGGAIAALEERASASTSERPQPALTPVRARRSDPTTRPQSGSSAF